MDFASLIFKNFLLETAAASFLSFEAAEISKSTNEFYFN